MIESPRWTRFAETCTEGATLKFVAENRLAIQTRSWLGFGVVRSSAGCTNTTRCGDHMNTVRYEPDLADPLSLNHLYP